MNSRTIFLVVLLLVACLGVGLVAYVTQAPRDPEGPPPGLGPPPDYVKNPPPQGPGASMPEGAPAEQPTKGDASRGTGKAKDKP